MKKAMDATIDRYCLLVENGNEDEAIRLVEEFDKANPKRTFVSLRFEIYGTNALKIAAGNGAAKVVKFLAERAAMTAPLDAAWLDGALFFAKGAATVDALIAAGGKVNALNSFGRTPLHAAAKTDRFDVVDALVRHGADLEAVDGLARTAAMTAAAWGGAGALGALARLGAHLTCADESGFDALSLALNSGRNEVNESKASACITVLLDAGIDPRAPTSRGEMPLDLAKRSHWNSIVALLEKKCLELNRPGRGNPAPKGYSTARRPLL